MVVSQLLPLYGSIYGSLYFSTIMTTAFYGITCMQTFFYYVYYQNDPLRIKSFVAVVWALNTIHEALTVAGAYKYIMAGLENPLSLIIGVPELILQLLFTCLVAVATQGFFVYRIYIFNDKKIVVPLLYVPLAIYQLVSTLLYVTKALYSTDGIHVVALLVLDDHYFTAIATSCLAVAAAVDIVIAAFLTSLLLRKRHATGYANTAHILQCLAFFAVNAGTWTATFALLTLIFLHAYPRNLIYAVFGFPLSSIYCNTLLANLNARAYIRGEAMVHDIDVDLFSSASSEGSGGDKGDRRQRVVSVRTSANVSDGHGGVTFSPVVASRPAIAATGTTAMPENARA